MFCSKCGKQLPDNAKFCDNCGESISKHTESSYREPVYDGKIHKCPNCGEILESFVSNCPLCGYELRDKASSSSVREFKERLEQIEQQRFERQRQYQYSYRYLKQEQPKENIDEIITKQKIELIKNFPIPNTKEDIVEFMVLACSNFDEKQYLSRLEEEDISDAWLSKIKQCYNKSLLVINDQVILNKIKNLYSDIMNKIEDVGNGKSNIKKDNQETKLGFKSWSLPAKIGWIILNIYTYGIPAIIYYFYRKSKEGK